MAELQSSANALCFAFRGGEMLVRVDADAVRVPRGREVATLLDAGTPIPAGDVGGAECVALAVEGEAHAPEGMEFRGLRGLHAVLGADEFRMAGRASQILEWDRAHRFCGRCGSPTQPGPEPLARACTGCDAVHYPRLSPAVLISIIHQNRILLARGPQFTPGMYSVLAGFVEPGESLEETCIREAREEVGVEIAEVRYVASQPWPFPSQVMIAFTSTYAGGEIVPQPGEIEEARWFTVDEIPMVPAPLSLSRTLIDRFVREQGGDPAALRDPRSPPA
ncbi:MAG TPA: NAD(+) diphosphatase [Longimicrobium sp.]|jgi:NAD+ diphosphatase|uniref:NAD(+) diphosphatase n=1 Tax=Longimicrobium sp. TaxID=2029185 RepID=UPI002ED937EC